MRRGQGTARQSAGACPEGADQWSPGGNTSRRPRSRSGAVEWPAGRPDLAGRGARARLPPAGTRSTTRRSGGGTSCCAGCWGCTCRRCSSSGCGRGSASGTRPSRWPRRWRASPSPAWRGTAASPPSSSPPGWCSARRSWCTCRAASIEAHFHFFILIGLIALYQDWVPFLWNVVFTVLSHGLGSAIAVGRHVQPPGGAAPAVDLGRRPRRGGARRLRRRDRVLEEHRARAAAQRRPASPAMAAAEAEPARGRVRAARQPGPAQPVAAQPPARR